ncbi:MAG: hypothetical protein ACPGU9_00560 [Flavobacteriaceae bacterium]
MQANFLHTWSKELKLLIGTFVVVLSIGFFSGLSFVGQTSSFSSKGIQENYLGNEDDEEADEMKFKKTERHMLSVLHSHILSMGMMFFIIAVLVYYVDVNLGLKRFLMVEPLISVLTTFGGIYLLWQGVLWMKYIVMISGALMTISYSLSVILIFRSLIKKCNA